jgi:hypothetical protein
MQLVQKTEDEHDPKKQCSTRANTISPAISQQPKTRKQSGHIHPTFHFHYQQAKDSIQISRHHSSGSK